MWNLIKAQNYQIKGDNIILYALIYMLFMPTGLTLVNAGFQIDRFSGGMLMAQMGAMFATELVMVLIIMVTRICGWDMNDKTINYEIMAGHSRGKIYFARVITGMMWSLVCAVCTLLIPLGVFTLINGWGQNMNVETLGILVVLMVFVLFRLIGEMVLLTFLVGKGNTAMVVGFALFGASALGQMLYQEFTGKTIILLTAYANLNYLFDFSNYKLEYIGGADIPVFLTEISTSMIRSTILVSFIVGSVCLAIGYRVFGKKDMN
ncbi:MAG: ABC transporter permease subunit [Lachnospiraceae bacterium]|nr:ABC transporter permease subunit [Lachnospiraceae bacterium]